MRFVMIMRRLERFDHVIREETENIRTVAEMKMGGAPSMKARVDMEGHWLYMEAWEMREEWQGEIHGMNGYCVTCTMT